MFTLHRKQTFCRRMAMVFLVLILNEIISPSVALALTGGPSQPEVHGFEPVGTSDMVDLFTGDFNYNIPLMDAGGYPINISYHAGASADDEGSWVGLGWSLTPGAMNREMRGLPDDFKGDKIKKEFNVKSDVTVGINAGAKVQFLGIYKSSGKSGNGANLSLGLNAGCFYNNYKGFGIEYGISPTLSLGKIMGKTDAGKDTMTRVNPSSPNVSLGGKFQYNSQSGLDADLSVGVGGIGLSKKSDKLASGNVGIGFNSRQGLKDLTFGTSLNNAVMGRSMGVDGSISFANRTYVPTNALPMSNKSSTFHGTVGIAFMGLHPDAQLTGYMTTQSLKRKTQDQPAFGYLNSQDAQKDRSALMDYNKEKQIPYRASQPNLPLSVGTYDLFSATGQGVSGQFRAMRNDVGIFRTPNHVNTSRSQNVGGEFGGGNLAHYGAEVQVAAINTVAGEWSDGKGAANNFGFTDQTGISTSADYEPVFIKNTGESATSSAADFRNAIGDNAPIAVKLKRNKGIGADDIMRKEVNGGNIKSELAPFSGTAKRNKREKRSQVFSYLNASEASKVGLDKTVKNFPLNQIVVGSSAQIATEARINSNRLAHHISEISVTQGDGSRYIYGIPTYNTSQEEASFAVAKKVPNGTLISYDPATDGLSTGDNSTKNNQGRDNYYDSQTLPPYAHAYLLTGVVSSDYVDIGNDGISDDDIGTNVKINYTKMPYEYAWRTPYTANQGRYNEGYQSDDKDDKASYVYGKKEVWYTHSIETKTMVAQFFLDDREDGLGVSGRNGGKDATKRLKYLSKIELYSKANLLKGDRTPIKTVHFRYDYSLCKKALNSTGSGVPNTTDENKYGKLTLRKIYFTYGNNTSGELNAYKFRYNGDAGLESAPIKMKYGNKTTVASNGTITETPIVEDIFQVVNKDGFSYNIDNYDRWGSYKEFTANPNNIDNKYYPYATQNKALADAYAGGWNLNKIELPSGGQINVKYESDDYAYVQDKRAGQMFPIKGFSRTATALPDNKLYERVPPYFPVIGVPSKYLHIDISQYGVTNLESFKKRYLEDVKQIYFNCLVNLKPSTPEYVKGYFDISKEEDIQLSTDGKTAIIPMVLSASTMTMNPIGKIALQTMRLELPQLVYPGYSDQEGQPVRNAIGTLFGIYPEIARLILGFDIYAIENSWVATVEVNKSWVRLANPNFKKLGGGSRVSEITVSNFNANTTKEASPNNQYYGQRYTYTTTKNINGFNEEISSGVASYEPMVGNEENLFREPMNYDEKVKMAPDNSYYMEKPFGESLFPGASVGYSSVKVQSIEPAGLKKTGTGFTVHEFFTAKDFPTVVDYTTKQHEKFPTVNTSFSLLDFFKINIKEQTGVSQGYTIEVNDMHGKPKAERVRNAYGADISWTEYAYRTDGSNHVKNDDVDVVNTEGVITHKGTIGYDFDVWHDMQQDRTETLSGGISSNLETFAIPFTPIVLTIPIPLPRINRQVTTFRSAVTTKFVKRFGILEKVTKMENGSTVSTENLLFDSETGQPLLTKTQNEFRDDMYQFSYPAHWVYDEGMGQAYKNIGLRADGVEIADGAVPASFSNYFVPGDELLIEKAGKLLPNRYNIVMVNGAKKVVDPVGELLPVGTYSLKITRSGRRNQASAAIGSVVSRKDPRQGEQLIFDKQILTAQAATFKDEWAITTGKGLLCTVGTVVNETNKISDPDVKDLLKYLPSSYTPTPTTLGVFMNKSLKSFLNYTNANQLICGWIPINLAECPPQGSGAPPEKDIVFNVRLSDSCNLKISGYSYNCWTKSVGLTRNSSIRATLVCLSSTVNCVVKCATGQQVNPYQLGIKGNWRPDAAYALYAQRTAPLSISAKKIRTDGDVVAYDNFWVWKQGRLGRNDASTKWVKTNTITHYDDKGNDIENYDALGIYSSALFRYKNTLASAVAANARRHEIAFDGFEDYEFNTTNVVEESCGQPHFDALVSKTNLSTVKAHTGNYSLVAPKENVKLVETRNFDVELNAANNYSESSVVSPSDHRQVLRGLPKFALGTKKSYVVSAWVSKDGLCTPTTMQGITLKLVLTYPSGQVTIPCAPKGTIVEGWQRIEELVPIGDIAPTSIKIQFSNASGADAYMDDLRILPAEGKMKSFVYDARTLRLMAQLDENNYATFYEYDDEGTLVRTKRETERGIVTIQENRSTLYRTQ